MNDSADDFKTGDDKGIDDETMQIRLEEVIVREESVTLREFAVSEREEAMKKREQDLIQKEMDIQNKINKRNSIMKKQHIHLQEEHALSQVSNDHTTKPPLPTQRALSLNILTQKPDTTTKHPQPPQHDHKEKKNYDMSQNFLAKINSIRREKTMNIEKKIRQLESKEASIKRRTLLVQDMELQYEQKQEQKNTESIFDHIGAFFTQNANNRKEETKKEINLQSSVIIKTKEQEHRLNILAAEEKSLRQLSVKIKDTQETIKQLKDENETHAKEQVNTKKEQSPWHRFLTQPKSEPSTSEESKKLKKEISLHENNLREMNKQHENKVKKIGLLKNHDRLMRDSSKNTRDGMLQTFFGFDTNLVNE